MGVVMHRIHNEIRVKEWVGFESDFDVMMRRRKEILVHVVEIGIYGNLIGCCLY